MAIFAHAVHGSFTVKDDCERQFWNGPSLELKVRINNRCGTWAINNHNLWAKYYANWWHYGWRLDCKLLYWSEQLSRWMSDESWFLRFRRKVSPELRERMQISCYWILKLHSSGVSHRNQMSSRLCYFID